MPSDDEVLERLDRLIALLAIAFDDQLKKVRQEIAADKVAKTILEAVKDQWVASGDLQRTVSKSAAVSEKTVQRALTSLADRGLLRTQGSGRTTSYRSSGLI